jgi:hypothetical protein
MEGNARTWFTPKQKAELWERCPLWSNSGQTPAQLDCPLSAKSGRRDLYVRACGSHFHQAPDRRSEVQI